MAIPENLNDWLGLIVPEETTNLVQNPSFERDVDGWTTNDATITRIVGGRFGGWCGRMVASAQHGYSETTIPHTVPSASRYTAQAQVYAELSSVRLVITDGSTEYASVSHPGGGMVELVASTVATIPTSTDIHVRIVDDHASAWLPVTFDGVQLEAKGYPTTYCDGDQDECRWTGARHSSYSRRPETARSGGRRRSFRDLGINVRGIQGGGVPPMEIVSENYAVLDGGEYQRTAVNPRVITLNCQALGQSADNLHDIRQVLLSSMIRQGSVSNRPVWLWYLRDGRYMQIGVHYEGGLEFGEISKFTEAFPIRLIAFDPYWQSVYDLICPLATGIDTLAHPFSVAVRKTDHESDDPDRWGWDFLGYQSGDDTTRVNVIEVAPNGHVYVAGTFSTIGGVSAANVAYWDGVKWNAIGSGVAADSVKCFLFLDDGRVLMGGSFTTVNGVSCQRIAVWEPEAGAVRPCTGPSSGTVYTLCYMGFVYGQTKPGEGDGNEVIAVGGKFSIGGGGFIFENIAFCAVPAAFGLGTQILGALPDGSLYIQVRLTGGTAEVRSLVYYRDELYIAGSFTTLTTDYGTIPGTPVVTAVPSIVKYRLTTFSPLIIGTFSVPAGATGITVTRYEDMLVSADGRDLYLSGSITYSNTGGIVKFDGSAFSTVGRGLRIPASPTPFAGVGKKLRNDPDGNLWMIYYADTQSHRIGGEEPSYATISGYSRITNVARWNGIEWTLIDVQFYGGSPTNTVPEDNQYIAAMAFNKNDELVIGSMRKPDGIARPSGASAIVTVDAPTPIQVLITPGASFFNYVHALINWSTGHALRFRRNLRVDIVNTVEVDTRPRRQRVLLASSQDGTAHLSSDSNLALFQLLPGKNKLALWTPGASASAPSPGSGALAVVYFRERFMSMDATPRDTL